MPFLRSATVPASNLRAASARAVTLAVALALAAVAPSPAHAEHAPTPRLVNDALPARALPPTTAPDASTFCPSPTGRWWDDYAVRGCIELLTGRDHTTPITDRELAWLDLGGLPAYATIDPDAIGEAIAAYEQRLADEAAAREVLEVRPLLNPRPQPTPVSRIRRMPTADELDSMMRQCGLTFDYQGFIGEHPCVAALWGEIGRQAPATAPRVPPVQSDPGVDHETKVHMACLESVPETGGVLDFRAPEYEAYQRAMATCKDRELPGYLARWEAGFPDHIRQREEAAENFRRGIERNRAFMRDLIETHCPDGGSGTYFAQSNGPTAYLWTCRDGTQYGPVYD